MDQDKKILDNYQIKYQWVDIDQESGTRKLLIQVNNGKIIIPTLVFLNGSILAEPTNQQQQLKLGLDAGLLP